ncbi:type IV secretory system conjugative DNA transfer family protein [Alicyclobacillus fodiniaquatilis]|uniref:Type IV secretory system conjugative DNA transfer family protein n=1 Tax=Alicyclobacillus fodiniaquatilis TaxID=1661150 RepID=A0ABW4JBF3_9BACL
MKKPLQARPQIAKRLLVVLLGILAFIVLMTVHPAWALVFVILAVAWRRREWFLRLWAFIRKKPYVSREERQHLARLRDNPLGESHFMQTHQSELATRLSHLSEVDGLIYGQDRKHAIVRLAHKEGHTLIVGGSGEGKTVSHVIPTLLSWQGSALVIDIKGELYEKTASYRRSFSRVLRFNPVGDDHTYNPIDYCQTVFQAQDLAQTLIPEPKEGDPFWAQAAQGIFAAAILEGNRQVLSLADVAARCIETPVRRLVEELSKSEHRGTRLLASGFVDLPDKALGGVAGEMRSKLLTLATDDDVIRATARSDFKASDLDKPTTLYLTIPESRLEQLRPLWTAVIQQIIRHMQERPEEASVPILVMLDEFPRLGKMPEFDGSLATLRSKNVHFSIVVQSLAQLDDRYGEDIRRIIVDNCSYKLILSATDDKTQKALSDLAGQRAVNTTSYSRSHNPLQIFGSETNNEQTVPLIRPEEFGRLGETAILFQPRTMPMRIQRLRWYENKAFQTKVKGEQGA